MIHEFRSVSLVLSEGSPSFGLPPFFGTGERTKPACFECCCAEHTRSRVAFLVWKESANMASFGAGIGRGLLRVVVSCLVALLRPLRHRFAGRPLRALTLH